MKHLFFIFLALGLTLGSAGRVQAQQPAPAQQPIVLKPGRMQAQARPAANRPDVPPQYVGGAPALSRFFQENVKYPEAARVSKVTGTVLTSFTISAEGRVTSPSVVKSLSPECDAEALRVLALMPAWKPATRKGQPVPIQVQLPVPFGDASTLKVEQGKTKFE
ncbi:energy transducer TonB [Hymenobacter chitinivorans]|uniref:Protein TonB n=1 Tax=Hymenobacter chitinivorans DSM 11115 TaxID=1121954 RepID=A0A2M9BMM5_9BACT|nr:energy transducer TonB [Hymenobacter chitinivorans]PJJ59182.1 protein TonB [Hymenobacter chitinivorans DSM 11115]